MPLANNEYPALDGYAPSWADILLRIAAPGNPTLDMKYFKSINTGRSVEVGEQKSGGKVIKRTTGEAKQEASCVLYREGHIILLEMLSNAAQALGYTRGNQVLISLVSFDIQMTHTPPGSVRIFDRHIRGCRNLSDAVNSAEGTDADTVDLGLHTMQIVDMVGGKEIVLL